MEIDTSQRGSQSGVSTPQTRAGDVTAEEAEFAKVQAADAPHANPHAENGSTSDDDASPEVTATVGDAPSAAASSEAVTETNLPAPADGITTLSSTAAVDAATLRD